MVMKMSWPGNVGVAIGKLIIQLFELTIAIMDRLVTVTITPEVQTIYGVDQIFYNVSTEVTKLGNVFADATASFLVYETVILAQIMEFLAHVILG